jgi:hypothetical protein
VRAFTARTDPSTLNRTMGVNMLGTDGPDRQRIRRIVELDRLPGLRLDPDRPVECRGWEFRAPLSTWVLWDAA